jgi:hypothetical protein
VKLVKQNKKIFLIIAFLLLVILPIGIPLGTVAAQTSGYTISSVDHRVEVMYSGNVVVLDTIHISGQITGNFMIGLPYKYSAYVLEALAFDDTHVYQMNLGVQLGDQMGFYAVEVNFNGNFPSNFAVAFVLSDRLITEQDYSDTLDYPAYPSLTQSAGTCTVNVVFPSTPTSLNITKDDGEIKGGNYQKTNLAAYTNSPATASFLLPIGTLQLSTISNLKRQIAVDPSGKVSVSDNYRITNNSTAAMNSFVLNVPLDATNVVVKDDVGRTLTSVLGNAANGNALAANATLVTFLISGQSTSITAQYNLPNVKIEDSTYVLADFKLFPDVDYYVEHLEAVFVPPEGATIVTPTLASLDSSSTLTRDTFQDTLTVTRDGISNIDYTAPIEKSIQLSYDYSPVWSSFRPTLWASLLAAVGSIALVLARRRRPREEVVLTKAERVASPAVAEAAEDVEFKPGQRVSTNDVKQFIDDYEDRKELKAELKSLDARAQRGKIPRRQYKVKRRAIEIRLESLTKSIERTKGMLRSSSPVNADIVKQLDSAEADLAAAEESIRSLETRQSSGEVTLEYYKKNVADHQKRKEKAESTISGILLRLREKTR